jgi:hypothetical protein
MVWDDRLYALGVGPGGGNTVYTRGDLVMFDSHNQLNQWQIWNYPALVSSSKGTISSSLVPIYFPNLQATRPAGAYTPSGAADYIKTHFGNQGLYVYPKINVRGLSNYIAYKGFSYNVTLPNGTVAITKIETQGANVGFVEARKTGFDIKDVVPASNPVGVNPNTYMIAGDTTKQVSKTMDTDKETSLTGYTLTGYIHPKPLEGYTEPSQYLSDVLGYSTSLDGRSVQIVLDDTASNCGMDQNLVLTPEIALRPFTKIYWTKASVKWDSLLRTTWANIGTVRTEDRSHSGTADVYWPYAVDVTNVFAITQFTFKVAVVTKNQISMVTSTGAPIDVEKAIMDFGSGAIIKNPNVDLTNVDLKIPPAPTFWDFLKNLFPAIDWNMVGTILIWILIGVGVVVGLVVYFRIRASSAFRRSSPPSVVQ